MLEAKIKHDMSYYRMPIYYPIQQFEDWMNIKIDGMFIDHGFRINDGKDSVYLEVTKKSPIRMSIKQGHMYGATDGIAIRLDVSGFTNGSIYIIGQPEYLPDERKLMVTNLKYDVQTESQAINVANAAIYDYMLEMLSGYLVLFIGDEIRSLPALISDAIESGKSAERLDLNIDTLEFQTWNFLVTRNNIQFVLNATAEASIEIERLRVRNPINITGD